MAEKIRVEQVKPYIWEIPVQGEMLVPGRIYANDELIHHLLEDVAQEKEWNALVQVRNVACLPGILSASLAMADVHPGYGFCIGGVGAFDIETGVVSVAGVGFDCNCGVRALRTPLMREDILAKQEELAHELSRNIPAGVGCEGRVRLSHGEVDDLLIRGAEFVVERGHGFREDLEYTEEHGRIAGARPEHVSGRAKERQLNQLGTLGSGNHYLEVQYVDEIFDEEAARAYGLVKDGVIVYIHCGSRGLGHQIGSDYLPILEAASKKYGIPIRERELVCAPIKSDEGRRYLAAVNCGVNYAFANRQMLAHLTRESFAFVMKTDPARIEMLYDVCHNNAKVEEHLVGGKRKRVVVHRKGSTRAFAAGSPGVPARYQHVGHPVLVGGTMGTCSYVLRGTARCMEETFGSGVHGAGRALSRQQAKKRWHGKEIVRELAQQRIIVKARSAAGVAEEAPGAYKSVETVVDVMHQAGINLKVARLKPLICIKG
ncbi:MAG: RtcB family protein [Candidatus Latescibacteria bacterium]|nr:RtcB family protein [Candidatus Latescibacterota bacterium]